jgi:prepilin signal peptidase PulO-like enzyme (type II secretory pathway)
MLDGVRILIAIVLWLTLVAIAVARSWIREPALGGGRRLDAAFWGVLTIALPV